MKYNIIPKERQRHVYAMPLRGYTVSAIILGIACILVLAAGIQLHHWAQEEQRQFMTQSLPIQQQVKMENARENALKQRADKAAAQEKKRVHWPAVLVMLAMTKPEEIAVEKLEVRQYRLIIQGREATGGYAAKWQNRLQQQELVKQAWASRKRGAAGELPVFQIEVELAHEEDTVAAPVPAS